MTDETVETDEAEESGKKSGGKMPLLFGLVAAILLGGGGFFAVYSGMIGSSAPPDDLAKVEAERTVQAKLEEVSFVPIEQIIVSLPKQASARNLRFVGQLEVAPGQAEAVEQLMPRIVDVLNTYLRAVDVQDFEEPSQATRLRAQMLRRVQVVAGEGLVRDLLITEFVLS
ncbi:flagellar basal body-associated FliL family protein [Amaricoccus macauensis]|uniref:flagellar basal body-associated FliL family protein n=1 Tax=Amaricoccus macauensis TaxID=57001 RepID=UPI003C7D0350